MRVTWRGLELPTRVEKDAGVSTDRYSRFFIEPFERGFGTTVGNSLRRVLLSSLEGSAVTSIKIAGVEHEFTSIGGVVEDATDIVLNVKSLVIRLTGEGPKTMKVTANKAGVVTAAQIVADPAIEVISKDVVLATLTEDVGFEMEMVVENGRGYVPVADRISDADRFEQEIGRINPFVQYFELGEETVAGELPVQVPEKQVDHELEAKLNTPIQELELSVRASNCLESVKVETVRQLVQMTDADLLKIRSFGKTSLREIKRKLADIGLSLGMKDVGKAAEG